MGAYWCLVELLYEAGGYVKRSQCDRIAYELRTDTEFVHRLIHDHELFEFDDEQFWADGILERLRLRDQKREKAARSASARWSDAIAERPQSDRNAIKGKVKGKEIVKGKEKIKLPTPPPSQGAEAPEEVRTEAINGREQAFQPTGMDKALLMRDDVAAAWQAFLAHRRKVKAPNSAYALGLVVKRLRQLRGDDGAGWAELLDVAVERGWRSVYEINKSSLNLTPRTHAQPTKPTLAERYNDRAREFITRHGLEPGQ